MFDGWWSKQSDPNKYYQKRRNANSNNTAFCEKYNWNNCRYLDGNLRAEGKINRIRQILSEAGIEGKAVDIVFVAPDEGGKLSRRIQEFQEQMEGRRAAADAS